MLATLKTLIQTIADEAIASSPIIVGVQQDVAVLKQDVAVLKQDVAVLKQDVFVLKQDVATLRVEMSVVKDEQQRQGLILDDMQDNIARILEVLTPVLKKGELVDEQQAALEKQAGEIGVTQTALRDHIADKSMHL